MPEERIVIYSDGSGNLGGKIGWAWVLLEKGEAAITGQGSQKKGTNNIAELKAVISGLAYIHRKFRGRKVEVISDSQYVVFAITHHWLSNWKKLNWKKANGTLKNPMLWKSLDRIINLIDEKKIKFTWVRGHAGTEFNEMADSLAEEAKTFQFNKIKRIRDND